MDKEKFDPEQLGKEIHTAPKERLLEMWRQADMRLLDFAGSRTDETYLFRNFLREGEISLDQDKTTSPSTCSTHSTTGLRS